MKLLHRSISLFFVILAFLAAACTTDSENTPRLQPSAEGLVLNGEGTSEFITLSTADWRIAAIKTLDASYQITGKAYDADGKLLRTNTNLYLDGMGKLISAWDDHGFVITRSDQQTLKVEVMENATNSDFNFVIVICSDTETKNIKVKQARSAGYTFQQIDYVLMTDSYKFVNQENGHFTFHNQTEKINTVEYNPMQNQWNNYGFESIDPKAFTLIKDQEVQIPSGVINGKLYYNGETIPYNNTTQKFPLNFSMKEITIHIPKGDSKCFFDVEYEMYKATYHLTLKNRVTGKLKIVDGTFSSMCPTGTSKLVWN